MTILLTAFEPFGGEGINASLEAMRLVEPPAGTELVRLTAEQSRTTAAMQDLAHEQHQTTRAINRAANETRRVGDLFNNFLNNR